MCVLGGSDEKAGLEKAWKSHSNCWLVGMLGVFE